MPQPARRPARVGSSVPMLARTLTLAVVLALFAGGVARAQGLPYAAETPVKRSLYRDGSTDRYLLAGTWLSRLDLTDTGVAQGLWRDVASTDGWFAVTVPNAYNASDHSAASQNGYVDWYRKDFILPRIPGWTAASVHWILRFESVNYSAQIWLNGRPIGSHAGAYLPFELDLSGLRAGVNRLILRVDNRRPAPDLPGFGAWWNYGGILREVYLRPVLGADLEQVQVRPLLPCPSCTATIDEQVLARNVTSLPQTVHLRGVFGTTSVDLGSATIPPLGTRIFRASVPVPHPRLWSPDRPTLYRASLALYGPQGKRLGGYVTYSGIRTISRTPDGRLELNGRLLDLRGVGLQESDQLLGEALDSAHRRRLIAWVRQLGGGLIRSHYPLHPEMYELADEYGILIWSEIPAYQVQSRYLTDPAWVRLAHSMLRTNILTNQNHPSVLLWSVGNELQTPAPAEEAAYIADAAALARQLDPTRPVGMAVSAWPGSGCQRAYAPLDVVGFNDYFGWYSVARGSTADRDELGPFLDKFRACYPTKALFVSEFGLEANRTGPVEERGTFAFQANSAAYHLAVFASKPWLSGAIYWALQDFVCQPGWSGGNPWPDPPFFHKGLVDLSGNLKPAFATVQAAFSAVAQIAPRAGLRRARTYTAAAWRSHGSRPPR